jgi:Zn-dependent metalloprotease
MIFSEAMLIIKQINDFIIWQAFGLMNRAIWLAADEAGFSRIARVQYYAIFIALRREPSFKRQKVSKSLSNYSERRKINLK